MTTEMEAFALLRDAFPKMTLIEVIQEGLMNDTDQAAVDDGFGTDYDGALAQRSNMTDVIANPDTGEADWSDVEASVNYPEQPANPHNHRFTISFDPSKPPFVVVRANTAAELRAAFDELVESGAYAVMAAAQAALKSAGSAPLPAAAGAPQFQAMAQQTFNQQPAQQFPGVTGQAPAQWQNAGAPAFAAAPPAGPQVPQGWYRLNVPFPQKTVFDAIVAQHGFKKADPNYGGQVSFQKTPIKAWYCAPEVAGAFAQFSPVDAHS
jgi:hypothetical protein